MPADRVAPLLLAVLALADAHSHPVKDEGNCTCEPGAKAFESYHIHVLFYPDQSWDKQFMTSTHGSKFARSLRKAFLERFNVPECDEKHIFNLTALCAFVVDETGACGAANSAPFVVPNFVIYLPVDRYADVVPWMMANRGDLDFLVHPNSCGFSCSPQDHLLWSVWGGNKWPVRFELPTSSQNIIDSRPAVGEYQEQIVA
jgi:aromatic ring-cleaving dioxygenase